MAAQLVGYAETGLTTAKFVLYRLSDGAVWNITLVAFEAYNPAHIADYGIAAPEVGVTGRYVAANPAEGVSGDFLLVKSATGTLTVADVANSKRYGGNTDSVAGIKTVTDELATTLETDGPNFRFTEAALANTPTNLGDGPVLIDHNYGGADALSYIDVRTSQGIIGADIRAFLQSDYDAGNRANNFIVARTTTASGGRWAHPFMLDPGVYVLLYFKQGPNGFGPDTATVTVS